jgi:hypothetical protein
MKSLFRPFQFLLFAALLVAVLALGVSAIAEVAGPLAAGAVTVALLTTPAFLLQSPSHVLGVAAAAPVNTPTRANGDLVYSPVAANTRIWLGSLVARDANGRAVPASNTAGLRVIGRAEETIDNTAGAAGDQSINLRLGVFKFGNSATSAIVQADVGKMAVVEDDNTVAIAASNRVCAGRILAVESDGVWIDTRYAYFGPRSAPVLASVQEATANGSDLATTQALANALKAKYNTLQADVAALHTSLFG